MRMMCVVERPFLIDKFHKEVKYNQRLMVEGRLGTFVRLLSDATEVEWPVLVVLHWSIICPHYHSYHTRRVLENTFTDEFPGLDQRDTFYYLGDPAPVVDPEIDEMEDK
jgi:hypothetical protein